MAKKYPSFEKNIYEERNYASGFVQSIEQSESLKQYNYLLPFFKNFISAAEILLEITEDPKENSLYLQKVKNLCLGSLEEIVKQHRMEQAKKEPVVTQKKKQKESPESEFAKKERVNLKKLVEKSKVKKLLGKVIQLGDQSKLDIHFYSEIFKNMAQLVIRFGEPFYQERVYSAFFYRTIREEKLEKFAYLLPYLRDYVNKVEFFLGFLKNLDEHLKETGVDLKDESILKSPFYVKLIALCDESFQALIRAQEENKFLFLPRGNEFRDFSSLADSFNKLEKKLLLPLRETHHQKTLKEIEQKLSNPYKEIDREIEKTKEKRDQEAKAAVERAIEKRRQEELQKQFELQKIKEKKKKEKEEQEQALKDYREQLKKQSAMDELEKKKLIEKIRKEKELDQIKHQKELERIKKEAAYQQHLENVKKLKAENEAKKKDEIEAIKKRNREKQLQQEEELKKLKEKLKE